MDAAISVIVPCYNGERFVAETVQSVLAQACDVRVIVVDDGSTDKSAAIVQGIADTDARVTLLSGPNRGVANARNAGVRAMSSASRFVMFLDADDVLVPGALSLLQRRLERDPSLAAAFGARSRIDEHGTEIEAAPTTIRAYSVGQRSVSSVQLDSTLDYWEVIPVNPISTPGQCLIRVAHLPEGEVFDQRCAPCEDWGLWLHLTRHHRIGVEHGHVLAYRDHDSSASRGYSRMHAQRAQVLSAQLSALPVSDHRRLRRAWRFAMLGFDARLCRRWAREHAARRDLLGALRFGVRSLRYDAKWLLAAARRQPDLDALASTVSGNG